MTNIIILTIVLHKHLRNSLIECQCPGWRRNQNYWNESRPHSTINNCLPCVNSRNSPECGINWLENHFFFRYFAAPQNRNIFSWIRTTYQMNCCSHWCVTSGKLNLIENGRMTNYCAYSNKMKNKQGNTNKEKKKNRLN